MRLTGIGTGAGAAGASVSERRAQAGAAAANSAIARRSSGSRTTGARIGAYGSTAGVIWQCGGRAGGWAGFPIGRFSLPGIPGAYIVIRALSTVIPAHSTRHSGPLNPSFRRKPESALRWNDGSPAKPSKGKGCRLPASCGSGGLDSGLRRNDGLRRQHSYFNWTGEPSFPARWIPACAGMTVEGAGMTG